ncbi:MAG: heavy-metal-associated domain-containing protein [Actinomycetota bacterium]|nr:heavy-metal-associated domain-containing protein [Actinomycetota bacterium]
MPDITLVVRGLADTEEAERLERTLSRLGFVNLVNVDPTKELVAVSYEGAEAELGEIGDALRDAGYEFEPSPGTKEVDGG